MLVRRVFVSFAFVVIFGITIQNSAFSQEYQGTWEQQEACTPDVCRELTAGKDLKQSGPRKGNERPSLVQSNRPIV